MDVCHMTLQADRKRGWMFTNYIRWMRGMVMNTNLSHGYETTGRNYYNGNPKYQT